MTLEKAKELFYQASDNALSYQDSTEVISIDSVNIILNEIFKQIQNDKTCESCKHWYGKSCMNLDSIAYGSTNAVYEDDYCKDHEEKLIYENCTNKNDF